MEQIWIGGEWVGAADGLHFPVIDPATEDEITDVPRCGAADVDRAVQAARAAQEAWRRTPGIERGEWLHEAARKLREHAEELAAVTTREGGKPLLENRDEVEWVAACFDYYAEVGRDGCGRVIAPTAPHQFNVVVKEPFGVVACIVPWNYPLLLLGWKIAPALAAGNTVVIKPSEHTPLSTLLMARRALQHLPPGVVNIVTGYGPEVGEPLVRHPEVDMIAFTGSRETGKRIATLAAEGLKKINLELGGKDPFIICDDVDLDVAVPGAVWSSFLNMGQVCTSTERIYVFEAIADEFIERFVEKTRALRVGNPMDPGVDLGPFAGEFQRAKVEKMVEDARSQGASVRTGGRRPASRPKGYFYEPTVLTDVTPIMSVMTDEIFGPVAPIQVVSGIEEACRLANDSPFGLGANLYTNNLEYAFTAMDAIKAGTFWINDPLTDNDAGPFGGMKQSGIGRELGPEGLDAFRDTKHVHLDYKLEKKSWWFPYP